MGWACLRRDCHSQHFLWGRAVTLVRVCFMCLFMLGIPGFNALIPSRHTLHGSIWNDSSHTQLNAYSLDRDMLYICRYTQREREFVLFTERMPKNRNTVDVGSTKPIKQTVIMVWVAQPTKCQMFTQRIFRCDLNAEETRHTHLIQPLLSFDCVPVKSFIWNDLNVTNCCNCKATFS